MMLDFLPFTGILFAFIYLVAGIFVLLWPILIWSHLREHTRYLAEIRDILKEQQKS
jgi:hypothetical protein